jgi:hypothetical protein
MHKKWTQKHCSAALSTLFFHFFVLEAMHENVIPNDSNIVLKISNFHEISNSYKSSNAFVLPIRSKYGIFNRVIRVSLFKLTFIRNKRVPVSCVQFLLSVNRESSKREHNRIKVQKWETTAIIAKAGKLCRKTSQIPSVYYYQINSLQL